MRGLALEGSAGLVITPGFGFRLTAVVSLVAGTMFLMWLGEQITERGLGNGISLIILAGIVAELPSALFGMFELGRQGALSTGIILGVIVVEIRKKKPGWLTTLPVPCSPTPMP